jgi:hypothetical protein
MSNSCDREASVSDEGTGPTSSTLAPQLAALPHLFGLSDGWSPGWQFNSPAYGYSAERLEGLKMNIIIIQITPWLSWLGHTRRRTLFWSKYLNEPLALRE